MERHLYIDFSWHTDTFPCTVPDFTVGLERSIFESLRGVIRCDTPTARFLLPYVVIAAISQSGDAAMTFMDEINSLVFYFMDNREKKFSGFSSEGKLSCISKVNLKTTSIFLAVSSSEVDIDHLRGTDHPSMFQFG